jgi:hypothetical protein
MQTLVFDDVHTYEPRSDYWSGQILKKISGESLYLTTDPMKLTIYCDAQGKPHSVQFANGKVWSFCRMNDRLLNTEWPLFLKDFPNGRITAARMFSDSMHLSLYSDNAYLDDVLIWRYPPVDMIQNSDPSVRLDLSI